MKLSFSTKGWHGYSWCDFCSAAKSMRFSGIELHNINGEFFNSKNSPFHPHASAGTVRSLYEMNLSIPCIDTIINPADKNCEADFVKEITSCIDFAKNLRIPYVRMRAIGEATDDIIEAVAGVIEQVLPLAEDANVTILVETIGTFSSTKTLCSVLDRFACDNLAALWDMYTTCLVAKETPEETIRNLGAYVKHVHIKDAQLIDGSLEYCLIGEGALPISELILALRSVNYDGFVCLEWDPAWMSDLDDMEIIFSHFVNFMDCFADTSKAEKVLYPNKLHNGKFVWKKDLLIDYTFSQVLDRMVEEFPDQYVFKYTTLDYTRTYAQFREDVDTCARAFIDMGVKAGSKVAVWLTNLPQWFIAFWAATKIGAVLVTVNTAYKVHEAEYLLRQSDTHTLILIDSWRDSNYAEIINELCPELATIKAGQKLHAKKLPFLRNVITVGFDMPGAMTWSFAMGRAENVPVEEVYRMASKVTPDDVCNMQYTSGTTGFPKGVMLTHYNVVNNGKCIGDRMDLSTADRMMVQVPMFHCFGMVLSMTATMTHGGTLLPLPYFSPKSALDCINREHITCFNGVPTMYIAMFNHPDFAKTDFSYMRTGIMAGANCPADLMRRAALPEEMNMRGIVSVYGQTEASPGCTMTELDDPIDMRCDTVGYALPHIECKVIDPDTGLEVADGTNGEFVARGYNLMKGYYKMPAATASTIDSEGWLHSGDLACREPDGTYRITGRLKDMIIRGGENIYPKEIEEFLYTNPKVSDVQVIGVPDKRYGEEIMACIILKDGESSSEEEIKEFVASHMARHKVPRYIAFVKSFPMNAAGKILKYKMRDDFAKELGLKD